MEHTFFAQNGSQQCFFTTPDRPEAELLVIHPLGTLHVNCDGSLESSGFEPGEAVLAVFSNLANVVSWGQLHLEWSWAGEQRWLRLEPDGTLGSHGLSADCRAFFEQVAALCARAYWRRA